MSRLLTMDDLLGDGEREEKERRAKASDRADRRRFQAFAAGTSGVPARDAGQVLRDAGLEGDGDLARESRRAHAELDRWLQDDGGGYRLLREILGTREAATRAAMLDRQDALRARYLESEARKGDLQREVDGLRREVGALRAQLDRSFELHAGQGR